VSLPAALRSLRRRWFPAFGLGTLAALITVTAAWLFLKPNPTVRGLLLVEPNPPKVAFTTADNEVDPRSDFTNYQKTQAALVKSRLVLTSALRQPKVNSLSVVREWPEPVEWLEDELQVDTTLGPGILRVSIKGDRPEELAHVVNAVADAYLREVVNKEHNKRLARLEQLKDIYKVYDEALRRKRRTLKTLAESAGSGDSQTLSLTHQFALEQLNAARKDLMQCRSELRRIEIELRAPAPAATRPRALPPGFADQQVSHDPVLARHLARVALLEEKVQKTKERSQQGEDDPSLVSTLGELVVLRKAIEARRKELGAGLADQEAARARDEARDEALQKARRAEILRGLEKTLEQEVTRLSDESRNINRSSLDLVAMRDELTKDEAVNKKIADEMEALKVEVQAPPRVSLLEEASVSWTGAQRKRLLGMILGPVAALGLFVFGTLWLDWRARRIAAPEDVVDCVGMRVVGSLPAPRGRAGARPHGDPDLRSQKLLVESIDAARTMLLHAASEQRLRVVLVTSALGGEGKTSLACHLAASLARSGRRTLLVDGDLRRPAAHQVFGLPNGPGFCALVEGTAKPAGAMQQTPVEGLWLVPAGVCGPATLRALAQDGARAPLAALREQFDFIVIDSSPVLPVADSLLVALHADGVLFSLLRDVSRVPTVRAAAQKVEALGVHVLGAVVSGTSGEVYGYEAAS
jgi:capsular exopolysaccharide synthesis family protein